MAPKDMSVWLQRHASGLRARRIHSIPQ